MNIDNLLRKYFDGETSSEEERQLRSYFSSAEVPDHLTVYKPLFAYFDEEIQKKEKEEERVLGKVISLNRRRILYLVSGVAAALLLLVGIRPLFTVSDPCLCEGNYVVINGRCYTDPDKIKELAWEALQEVTASADEYFPEKDADEFERNFIENQFKELSSLFSDDD